MEFLVFAACESTVAWLRVMVTMEPCAMAFCDGTGMR